MNQSESPLVIEWPQAVSAWKTFRAVADLPYPLFLDSVLAHPTLGRYSYVTADPFAVLRCRGTSNVLGDPFAALRNALAPFRAVTIPGLPPFQGGAAGLFGYDLCHHIERLPRPKWDEFESPDMVVGLYDWVVAFDHAAERSWLISTGWPEQDEAARAHRRDSRAKAILQRLGHAEQTPTTLGGEHVSNLAPQYPLPTLPELTSNFSRDGYLRAVERAVAYTHAGDCFQVNLSQRLLTPLRESPLTTYERLRTRNPATFGGYFDIGDFAVASASPERFLKVSPNGDVETRPIKGTRPRGQDPIKDLLQIESLRTSEKDRAENVMIVDLLRNDLGRVCAYGSIHVPAVCEVESYRTVHHLVSTVCGKLRPDRDAIDLLRASFPGGSVTGAPKIRAMEIIAELEPTARGPYCGSLGTIGFDGAMDSNILIRTFTMGKGWIQCPVGGGIVADSDPEREYEETLHKAEGMLRALQR